MFDLLKIYSFHRDVSHGCAGLHVLHATDPAFKLGARHQLQTNRFGQIFVRIKNLSAMAAVAGCCTLFAGRLSAQALSPEMVPADTESLSCLGEFQPTEPAELTFTL